MTYLAGFIVIRVKGLFRSDWLGASLEASPIGPQLVGGKMGNASNPTAHYGCKPEADLAGFF
jgi:hypothetical protein